MGDDNCDFEPYLYTTTLNFVDSLFNEEDNSNLIKKDNKPSKGPIIQKSKQNKTKELNLKPNILKENKTNSKTNFSAKKKPLIFRTTGKRQLKTLNNSNSKFLTKDKTTKSNASNASNVSNYFTQSTANINHTFKTERTHYSTASSANINLNSSSYEIYRAKKESYREKKLYEERVKLMQNHIKALKKQEEELNKKAEIDREKEKNKDKRKQEKETLRQALLSMEIDKRNELEEKKKNIMQQKMKNNLGLKESQERYHRAKMQNYKKAIDDKKKVEVERKENKHKKEESNHMLFMKMKGEREKTKENFIKKKNDHKNRLNTSYKIEFKNNVDETQKLKNELTKLELMEEKCLENLKKTMECIKKNNKNNSILKRISNSVKKRSLEIIINQNEDIKDDNETQSDKKE